jgi:hypothetical protein
MTPWSRRPVEERALLNPSFCSMVLWHAIGGYAVNANAGFPVEVAFLILPLVLHGETREALPSTISTSLAVWLDQHPLVRARFPERARMLAAFTREGLTFGGLYGLLVFAGNLVTAQGDRRKTVQAILKTSSDEVRACAKKAEFVGRWLAKAGTPATVMALIGVRP